MFGHCRSPANAAPNRTGHLAPSDGAPAPAAGTLATNSSTGSALPLEPSAEGNTRIPQLLASSVLAVIGAADESCSARLGRLRQAPSLALCCEWRRRFTVDDAGELTGPYLGDAE
jgi:hypothetical protein